MDCAYMKLALIGYGKMGHELELIARERGHEVVCVIDPVCAGTSHTLGGHEVQGIGGFESDEFGEADVAIEFTTPTTAEANIRLSWSRNVPVVCGTTGWDVDRLLREVDEKHLTMKAGRKPLVWKSNFSVGVNVFFELNRSLAHLLQPFGQYSPSITETHHVHKLDKPSGTAKTLAQAVEQVRGGEVPIESIREGEVPGIHTIEWDSEEDTLVITHIAKGRRGFALGALLAAEELGSQILD